MIWLLGYLTIGVLFGYANDKLVVGEHTGGFVERANFFVRATLAWPTYLIEDSVMMGNDDPDN